jgi:hypothetical protein
VSTGIDVSKVVGGFGGIVGSERQIWKLQSLGKVLLWVAYGIRVRSKSTLSRVNDSLNADH